MAREYLRIGPDLGTGNAARDFLNKNRKATIVGLLILTAGLNLLDLVSTLWAVTNGFVETYPTSMIIIGTTGSLGFGLAKSAFSFLLIGNAYAFRNRFERIGGRAGLLVMVMCFVIFAAYVAPVANNILVLLHPGL